MRFIRENPALAAGLGLPVLLVILFSLASLIPQWTVEPPKYSLLFTTDGYTQKPGYQIILSVSQGHLKAEASTYSAKNFSTNVPHLYLFDAKEMTVHEITLNPTAGSDSNQWQEFAVPEVASLTIDPRPKAPDGYEFHQGGYGGNDIGWPFFFNGGYNRQPSIAKGGRVVPIRQDITDNRYYNAYNTKFLGWIVPGATK